MLPYHTSCIHTIQLHLVYWIVSMEIRVYYSIYLLRVSLIISSGPDNCSNPCSNNTLLAYSWHPIRYDGLYLVNEYALLWSICVNFHSYKIWLWNYQIHIQYVLSILLLRRVYEISHPLKCCNRKRVYFWCGIWEVYFLTSNWVSVILVSPSYLGAFKNKKFSYCNPHPFELDLDYPVVTM